MLAWSVRRPQERTGHGGRHTEYACYFAAARGQHKNCNPRFSRRTLHVSSLCTDPLQRGSSAGPLRGVAPAETPKGTSMSYGEVRKFLAQHTELVELTNREGPGRHLPPVARTRDDLDLRRAGRSKLRLHQRRVHPRRQARTCTSPITAPKIGSGCRPKGGSSASGSSRASNRCSTTGTRRRPSMRERGRSFPGRTSPFAWPPP